MVAKWYECVEFFWSKSEKASKQVRTQVQVEVPCTLAIGASYVPETRPVLAAFRVVRVGHRGCCSSRQGANSFFNPQQSPSIPSIPSIPSQNNTHAKKHVTALENN